MFVTDVEEISNFLSFLCIFLNIFVLFFHFEGSVSVFLDCEVVILRGIVSK